MNKKIKIALLSILGVLLVFSVAQAVTPAQTCSAGQFFRAITSGGTYTCATPSSGGATTTINGVLGPSFTVATSGPVTLNTSGTIFTIGSNAITTSSNNFGGITNASVTALSPIIWNASSVISCPSCLTTSTNGTVGTTTGTSTGYYPILNNGLLSVTSSIYSNATGTGIGTTTPGFSLEVAGSARASVFRVPVTTGRFIIESTAGMQAGTLAATDLQIFANNNLEITTGGVATSNMALYINSTQDPSFGTSTIISGAVNFSNKALRTGSFILAGSSTAFANPFVFGGQTPGAFIYLDSTFNQFRIGVQGTSTGVGAIAFELPNGSGYQDAMALSSTTLSPSTSFDNLLSLGSTGARWKNLVIGTGTSTFAGPVAIGTTTASNQLTIVSTGASTNPFAVFNSLNSPLAQLREDSGRNGQLSFFNASGTAAILLTTNTSTNSYFLGPVSLGTTTLSSTTLNLQGSLALGYRSITVSSTITQTDAMDSVSSTVPVKLTLPLLSSTTLGQIYHLKDASGNAGTQNITIQATSTDKIDGTSTYIMNSNYQAIMIVRGTNGWEIQ